jgi:diacylglycerol kinase family enzyme
MLLTVANGKYFGSGIGIAPDANITDGKLDVVVIGDVSKWEYIRNIRDAQNVNTFVSVALFINR